MSKLSFKIKLLRSFETDLKKAGKQRYKKNKSGAEEFLRTIAEALEFLQSDPYATYLRPGMTCDTEPYPDGHAISGCVYRKLRFAMPQLHGASALGRIPFEVDADNRVVRVLAFYTHQLHKDNYSKKELADRLKSARQPRE